MSGAEQQESIETADDFPEQECKRESERGFYRIYKKNAK
jgi:hypothetical protein